MATSGCRFLPISAGSMSACTTLRVRREGGQLARDPVIEPGAERDDQVAFLEGGDRREHAVHARHAESERVAVRERAACHQRRGDGCLRQFSELQQGGVRFGLDHASADIEHGLAGLPDQLRPARSSWSWLGLAGTL